MQAVVPGLPGTLTEAINLLYKGSLDGSFKPLMLY